MLGYLSLREGWETVEGVRPNDPAWVARTTNVFQQKAYPPFEQLDVIHKMAGDPPHEWTDIARQIGNPDADGNFPMNGFVANYATAQEKPDIIDEAHPPVMGYFSGERVPVTDLLATNFAVCDHWFSSLPAGTQANRLMSMAGYSLIAHNTFPLPNHQLVYDWLDARKVNWRVYHEGLPFFAMMPNQIPKILTSGRFRPLETLWDDVNNEAPDQFPEVIFVEPWYTDGPHPGFSRDDHAPSSIVGGQQFLNEVYRSIRVNPNWAGTVMIVNYDEHGGFFDHVSPPIVATPAGGDAITNPGFSCLGVRVQAMVVSPLVSPGSIFHKRLAHTSVLKFIGEKFGSRNGMEPGYSPIVDARDVNSVYDVLNLASPSGDNPPTAIPLDDEYLNQPLPKAGYVPECATPPSILAQAFKIGLDTMRTHPDFAGSYYDELLDGFPPDPKIHLL
jgi:phospholipase C